MDDDALESSESGGELADVDFCDAPTDDGPHARESTLTDVTQPATRPIGSYERRRVSIQPWDPRVVEVAAAVAALVRERRPELRIEHIGSTAVAGLPGKGIVDLGTEAPPEAIPGIVETLYELGFGPQPGPDPWPATRPMVVGSYVLDGREYRIHLHVHPLGGDLEKDVRFRDGLRQDPQLAQAYAGIKQQITDDADTPVDAVFYQEAKGGWIQAAYRVLGIDLPQQARRPHEADQ